jgi:RNA polymerase sigma-70 factor (ECF subfamily)
VEFAASYVGSIDDGEEVVAEVFVRLWEHRATWTVTSSISAYVFGAVRNGALDVVRRRARDRRRETMFRDGGETPGVAVPPRDLAERVERDDYATLAGRLIAKLPERRRLILSLRWNYDLTWDEIAAVLGVTRAAVQREHSRILASLRAELPAL